VDFGDGDTSSDCDPCHVFTNCGPYVVSVTVSDGLASTNATSLVTVTCELTITKMQIKLNFAKTNSDSLQSNCRVGSRVGLQSDQQGRHAGHRRHDETRRSPWTQRARGKVWAILEAASWPYNKKMKQWTLRAKLAKGSWQASWATYGLENKECTEAGHMGQKCRVVVLTGDDALAAMSA